jgi:NAD-dependent DNA ligase
MNAIECLILAHRYLYHTVDAPIISDDEYDTIKARALKLFPESEILNSDDISDSWPPIEVYHLARVISGYTL